MIIENKIKCKKCGDVIVSENRHDFKFCSCGACAVDGGFTYLRRVGELEDWEELSTIKEFEWEKALEEIEEEIYKDYKAEQVTVDKATLRKITSALYDYSLATARYLWMLKNNKKL